MSRERFLDPGIWTSEQFCSVSREARLLFVGLVTTADDCGFGSAAPHRIKLNVFPSDNDVDKTMIVNWLGQLVEVGLVELYGEAGGPHYYLPTFMRWQPLKYRSRSKRLQALVDAGLFQLQVNDQGRVIDCSPVCPDLARSGQVLDSLVKGLGRYGLIRPESRATAESRVVGRGVEGRGQRPPSPPCPLTLDVSVADSGLTSTEAGKVRTTPAQQTTESGPPWSVTPTSEPAASILRGWLNGAGKEFRKGIALQQLVNVIDHKDPQTLLAHLRDIEGVEEKPSSRCAILWARLAGAKNRKGKPIVPSERAMDLARAELNADGEPRGGTPALAGDALDGIVPEDDDDPGGGLSSPAAGLQEKLEERVASRDEPAAPKIEDLSGETVSAAADPPKRSRRRRRRRRDRAYDEDLAEVPEPIQKAFDGLTAGWSGPDDTNHDPEKRTLRALLAGDAVKALAYVDQVNRTAIIGGLDPWLEAAKLCRDLVAPDEKGQKKALEIIGRLSSEG